MSPFYKQREPIVISKADKAKRIFKNKQEDFTAKNLAADMTVDMDSEFPYMRTLDYSAKWHGWNCCNYLDDEKQAKAYEMNVTHWMPLPDEPEVEG